MLRLAVLTARGRLAAFTGAFIALMAASVLTMAWGMQLESVLRGHPPVERYAGAAAVVTGQQTVGADDDVLLAERARVDSALAGRLAAVPGVKAAIGDVAGPVRPGGREAVAHGGSSAALTPYVLGAGGPPAGPGEVVDVDGHTVVMVTHDPVAAAYADRVILLADGRIAGLLDGPDADEVAEHLAHLGS